MLHFHCLSLQDLHRHATAASTPAAPAKTSAPTHERQQPPPSVEAPQVSGSAYCDRSCHQLRLRLRRCIGLRHVLFPSALCGPGLTAAAMLASLAACSSVAQPAIRVPCGGPDLSLCSLCGLIFHCHSPLCSCSGQDVQPSALLQATALDQDTPPPATRKQAAAPPQDTTSATALPQELQPSFEAVQVPPCPLSCPSCNDEQSAKCSRRICLNGIPPCSFAGKPQRGLQPC